MAIGTSIKFGRQTILIGDGSTPTEAFTAPCGVTDLTLTVNTATAEVNVPDCSDPDLPSWLVSDVVSKQMVLSGSGTLVTESLPTWQELFLGSTERNIQFSRNTGGGTSVDGVFEAPAILTQWDESASLGNRWTFNFSFNLNGEPTFTPST